tara:strand:+ start:1738 stop:2733 length:996 start_codon:yes stop_codon:yes gene_type:complete
MSGKKETLKNKNMKHLLTLEKFSKQYQQKIDVKDFKKIKKGSKILYMGGQVEVMDNNGYVLKLKGENGKTFTVNKNQFDHGGMIKEGVLDNITLMADASKNYEDFKKKFKKGFPKIFKSTPDFMDWLYGMYKDMAPDKVEEVNDGKKKKKKKEFHPDMMYESKGKKVVSDIYKDGGQIDYLSDADDDTKKIWKKAGINPEDDDMIILYSYVNNWIPTKKILNKSRIKYKELEDPNSAGESFIVFNVNELSSQQDGTKASDGKHKHEDHLEEDLEAMWKKIYGEDFVKHYPAVAKIIRQRKLKDKREIARIWQDTYGEDFEKEYPALYQKLS